MLRKLLIIITVVFVLSPWPVAYAYSNGPIDQPGITISMPNTSDNKSFPVFGQAIGTIPAVELFYISAVNHQGDIGATLYLTNSDELVHCYRYMILECHVFVSTGNDSWEDVTSYQTGGGEGQVFLTLRNGRIGFELPGGSHYKVTIERGNYYCLNRNAKEYTPAFYLEASEL